MTLPGESCKTHLSFAKVGHPVLWLCGEEGQISFDFVRIPTSQNRDVGHLAPRLEQPDTSCEDIHPTDIPKCGGFSTPQDENAVLLRSK
jgi:hypothetical protein